MIDWLRLYVSPLGSRLRIERESRRLVRLEHLHARLRQEPENRENPDRGEGQQHQELLPADADEEENGEERSAVDERRPEVGLEEDEQDGNGSQPDRRQHRPPAVHPTALLHEEACDREDEQDLAELGGLELDESEVDPALGAANGLGDEEDEEHQRERRAVEEPPVSAHEVDRHDRGDREPDQADPRGDRLPDDEVVLVPRNVEARDARDHPEPVRDQRERRPEEDPVEAAHEGERMRLAPPAGDLDPRTLRDLDHQSVSRRTVDGDFTPKYRSKTRRAAGAAAVEP